MHAIEIADLAGTFVSGTPAQYALRLPPAGSAPQGYWLTTQFRHEEWMRQLALHRDSIQQPGLSRRLRNWTAILPVLQEILLSEPLSRVVAYHAAVLELFGLDREFSPLATSALATHIEARNRCLHLIVFGQGMPVEDAVRLNRLRRSLERYTDELLACLPALQTCALYGFEAKQLTAMQAQAGSPLRQSTWTNLQVVCSAEAMWRTIRHDLDWRSGNARLNYLLSQDVLRLINTGSFDSFGTPHTSLYGLITGTSPECKASAGSPLHPLFQNALPASHPVTFDFFQCHRLTFPPRRLQGD
jgi:hypothetical protein